MKGHIHFEGSTTHTFPFELASEQIEMIRRETENEQFATSNDSDIKRVSLYLRKRPFLLKCDFTRVIELPEFDENEIETANACGGCHLNPDLKFFRYN